MLTEEEQQSSVLNKNSDACQDFMKRLLGLPLKPNFVMLNTTTNDPGKTLEGNSVITFLHPQNTSGASQQDSVLRNN